MLILPNIQLLTIFVENVIIFMSEIDAENIYNEIKLFSRSNDEKTLDKQLLTNIKKIKEHFEPKIFTSIFLALRQILINNTKIQNIETNIFKVITKNDIESAHYLVENKLLDINQKNEEGKSILSYCIECQNNRLFEYFNQFYHNFEFPPISEKPKDYVNDIFQAVTKGKLTSVQWLIEKENVNKNKKDELIRTPLHWACKKGYFPIVKYLISKGADVNTKDNQGNCGIHYASKAGFCSIVEYLIEKGNVDKDIKGEKNKTPLYYGCFYGHKPIAQYLISKGADVNLKDKSGDSIIHCAVRMNLFSIVKYLIEKKNVDVNCRGIMNQTPLHCACEKGNLTIVQYLISKGAQIEAAESFFGRKPLHIAVSNENVDIVKYLVSIGADKNASDNDGETPIHIAIINGNNEIINILKNE